MKRRLPEGMYQRKGRSGFYMRRQINGRRRWILLAHDQEEAGRQLRKRRGSTFLGTGATVAQAAEQWLESYVRAARNPQGLQLARQRVRDWLDEFMGAKTLDRVKSEDWRRYGNWLGQKGKSPQTVKHILSDARCFMNWCEEAELVERSTFPKRIMPRIKERLPDRLTDEEAAVLRSLPDPDGFIIRLGLRTGLRIAEIMRARTDQISDGVLGVENTKSGKVRRVPLPPELLQELRGRVGKLCPFASGSMFNKRVKSLSGIESFHAHQLRHTFACKWLESGGSLAALQELLGHASIVTTQQYARLGDLHVRAEAERIFTAGEIGKGRINATTVSK